jgi:PAS domain S-box-containing protein/TyrR family helix-turn-helix protein
LENQYPPAGVKRGKRGDKMGNRTSLDPWLVLNSIYNGIVAINRDGLIVYFNKTAERIFNVPEHDAIDRYILDVLPNTGIKLVECLKTATSFYGEKLNGQKVTLVSNINPILADGNVCGVISVFQDISEVETISKELDLFKTVKNWLDTIIDSSYDGLWICDHEGKVVRINKAAERMHGVKADEVVGKSMSDLERQGLIDKSATLEVFKRKATVTMIQKIRGEKKILVTSNPIFNDREEITFVVSNDRDMSEMDNLRKKLEETQVLAKGYSSKLLELEMRGVDLSSIIFRSAEMVRIIELVLKLAQVDSTVLLLGESGVGKGIMAKLIHKQSTRNHGPFVRVDCAGIPDSLIESELFGYEKGAFTGAKVEGKVGLLELANKGSLFLDEIGEIPSGIQSKLLRFLEDHEIMRVGGTEPREIDVRIIAATNKDLEKMVLSKTFREDLYYRLNVVPIRIPSLRERRDDILPLIYFNLTKFNEQYRKNKSLSAELVEALCRYDYPGNVRELANLVERVFIVSEGDRIELEDLPKTVSGESGAVNLNPPAQLDTPLKQALERYEQSIIQSALKKYGSQREAARKLNVNQATISKKIKKYSIPRNQITDGIA